MNRALHLDFLGGRWHLSKLGWAALLAGAAIAGWQLLAYRQLLQFNAALRSELQSTQAGLTVNRQDAKRQQALTPHERSMIVQARAAATQLNYPWESLLNLMETVQHPDVALLALDPKSRNGQIRLTAEAKDASAMMSYVAALQQTSQLQNALLTTHQIQTQQPGSPFKFQILAQWKDLSTAVSSDTADASSTAAIAHDKSFGSAGTADSTVNVTTASASNQGAAP